MSLGCERRGAVPTLELLELGLGFLSQFGFLLIGPFQEVVYVPGHWETGTGMGTECDRMGTEQKWEQMRLGLKYVQIKDNNDQNNRER